MNKRLVRIGFGPSNPASNSGSFGFMVDEREREFLLRLSKLANSHAVHCNSAFMQVVDIDEGKPQ